MADKQMTVALWTVFNDRDFVRQYGNELDPETLPRGAARYLLTLALEAWAASKALLTPASLELMLDETSSQSFGTTDDETAALYADVYGRYELNPADISLMRAAALKWFRGMSIGQRLDNVTEALDHGDLDAADKALRDGHRVLQPMERGKRLEDFRKVKYQSRRPAMPTGFSYFDTKWYGGLHLGQLGMVIAPYNTGKSMVLPWFAGQALKDNRRVLYYTTEVDDGTILTRVVSSIVNKPINTMDPEAAWERLWSILNLRAPAAIGAEEGAEPFIEVAYRDALSMSVRDIESDLDMLAEEGHRIHLVIIDGDDLRAEHKYERAYDMYLQIYTDLSNLATRRDVAIWTAAQGNKDSVTAKVVNGQHVADSMAKIRKSDMALGLQHLESFIDEYQNPIMNITVSKDRYYGTRGKMIKARMYFGRGVDGWAAFGDSELVEAEDGRSA